MTGKEKIMFRELIGKPMAKELTRRMPPSRLRPFIYHQEQCAKCPLNNRG